MIDDMVISKNEMNGMLLESEDQKMRIVQLESEKSYLQNECDSKTSELVQSFREINRLSESSEKHSAELSNLKNERADDHQKYTLQLKEKDDRMASLEIETQLKINAIIESHKSAVKDIEDKYLDIIEKKNMEFAILESTAHESNRLLELKSNELIRSENETFTLKQTLASMDENQKTLIKQIELLSEQLSNKVRLLNILVMVE